MPSVFRLPRIAANTAEAVLVEWAAGAGQSFSAGDVLATVETDKALVEITADADGVVSRHLAEVGETVQVGAPIAVLAEVGEPLDGEVTDDVSQQANGSQPAAEAHEESVVPSPAVDRADAGERDRLFASPLARRLAAENGLQIGDIAGSGPRGRIVRADVEKAAAASVVAQRPTGGSSDSLPAQQSSSAIGAEIGFEDIPHTRIRRAIATRLTESTRDVPHFYLRAALRADRLVEVHSRMRAQGQRVSLTDLIVKAVARAHALVPAMNVIWQDDSVRKFSAVDVAVAVSVDGGLVTPVLRDVDRRTLTSVASDLHDLIVRARSRRLVHDELAGGTITVSSLGMFGVQDFAAIINPPQSAILAVGAVRPEPVVDSGVVVKGQVLRVTLSVDHRPVDGVLAAEWLKCLTEMIEEPALFLS